MNLNNHPTVEELIDLISAQNDNESNHIIWVSKDGEVHISSLQENMSPIEFDEQNENLEFRFETLIQGNGWVGENAAQDMEWVRRLYNAMLENWTNGNHDGYIDVF